MALTPKDPPETQYPEETRVDLGDDLLVSSKSLEREQPQPHPGVELSVREELDSVRILLSEGLLAEARRTLFRVLRKEPNNSLASRLLEEIRNQEVQGLLNPQGRTRPSLTHLKESSEATPEELIQKLNEDLKLGLDSSPQEQLQCASWIREHLAPDASLRERMDWAVAFLSLDQPVLATQIIESAGAGSLQAFETQGLLAEAYLLAAQPEHTRMIAERALRDPDLQGRLRNEFTYLRARALESLERLSEAASIFKALGNYRDSSFRSHRLLGTVLGPDLGSREKI